MYETVAEPHTPRLSVISTVVNQPVIQPYLFCNYRHHPNNQKLTHYLSACDVRGWEAVMASTAAPGYFEEVKLGNLVHQVRELLATAAQAFEGIVYVCNAVMFTLQVSLSLSLSLSLIPDSFIHKFLCRMEVC